MGKLVIITGSGGQLGHELLKTAPPDWQLVAMGRQQLDIGDAAAVQGALRILKPSLIINAAAYTAVDQAEREPVAAQRGNAEGPANLAAGADEVGARLLHVSTDFVFNGHASVAYTPEHETDPLSVYGLSKRDGETAVLARGGKHCVVRTGWVYASHGRNFLQSMLRLLAERQTLGVVDDQIGTPTWAQGLAQLLWRLAERQTLRGIYHYSDAGVASWYDFACAIRELASERGLLRASAVIQPIPSSDYPTPAQRPRFSVLDKRRTWRDCDITPSHWRTQLAAALNELRTPLTEGESHG
jgi:dTDP-4-dehydrorhamnose reductase